MCAKVISISYTCWATYNNQKTTTGQEVHKIYPFQALFLAYWGFQKYQTKVTNFAPRMGGPTGECLQLQGASPPPEPLTKGSAPGPRWGLCPQTSVIGSRSALAMSPTRAFCPPHCFRPGDAPDWD